MKMEIVVITDDGERHTKVVDLDDVHRQQADELRFMFRVFKVERPAEFVGGLVSIGTDIVLQEYSAHMLRNHKCDIENRLVELTIRTIRSDKFTTRPKKGVIHVSASE